MISSINMLKIEYDNLGKIKSVPNESGIYKIYLPTDMKLSIKMETDSINEYYRNNERICLKYNYEYLLDKWNNSNNIILNNEENVLLYVGSSNNLNKRITQLVKYRYKLCDNHRGGRALWHIEQNESLLVEVKPCKDARKTKEKLLTEIMLNFESYPFANWKK